MYKSKVDTETLNQNILNMIEVLEKYGINVFKPTPAPIDKIQNKYRWRIIAKGNVTKEVNIIINKCLQNIYEKRLKNVNLYVDINPNNMS